MRYCSHPEQQNTTIQPIFGWLQKKRFQYRLSSWPTHQNREKKVTSIILWLFPVFLTINLKNAFLLLKSSSGSASRSDCERFALTIADLLELFGSIGFFWMLDLIPFNIFSFCLSSSFLCSLTLPFRVDFDLSFFVSGKRESLFDRTDAIKPSVVTNSEVACTADAKEALRMSRFYSL